MQFIFAKMLLFSFLHVTILFISYSGSSETNNDALYFNEWFENGGNHIKTECANFLRMFANATKHFNWCIVRNAKPLRMCEKCTSQYSRLLTKNPVGSNPNSSHCVDELIRSERFQVVMKVYEFQTGLWDSAHCEKCYESKWNLTHDTGQFLHRLKRVNSCFKNYTIIHPINTNSSDLCSACRRDYLSLRRIYNKILEETTDNKEEDELCVDIMSLMNDTRRDWTNFDCNKVKEKNYTVLSLSGMFGFLTFIYYAAVRKHEKYRSKLQSRSRRAKQIVNYDSE